MNKLLITLFLLLPMLASAQINITNITHAATVSAGDYALGTTGGVTRLLPVSAIAALGGGLATNAPVIVEGTNIQISVSGLTNVISATATGSAQTNISYTAVTNAPWQYGSVNGTNWSQVSTNALSNITSNRFDAATWTLATNQTSPYLNISNIFAGTVDVRDYGAIADGVQLTNAAMTIGGTSLTCTEASFTVADVGKHVQVVDGMDVGVNLEGTITAWVNSTNVTISETCSNAISGQVFYGTENAVPFQLAVNASITNGFGGAVYAENGNYLFDREWQSNPGEADANGSRVQITLPSYRGIAGTNMVLRIFGNVAPYICAFPRVDVIPDVPGVVIMCARTALDTTNYTIIGAPRAYPDFGFNYVRLTLENLTFRTQKDGRICPLNLKYHSQVNLENIAIDVGVAGNALTNAEARYDTRGVIYPGLNNDIQSIIANVRVTGFRMGMTLGECASYDQIVSSQCSAGFELPTMWHGLHVNYGYALNCGTGIVAKLSTSVGAPTLLQMHWAMFDTEDNGSGGYDDMKYAIYDPNSCLYGDIYMASTGLSGYAVPKCYGATNLTLHIPGQGVYNNFYSFGRLDTANNISLYLGSTRAGSNPESDVATLANATITVTRDTGHTLINAKAGDIKFYRAQAGNPVAVINTNGFIGSGRYMTNLHGTNIIGAGNASEYLKGDGTWDVPSGGTITTDSYNIWTGSNVWNGSNTFNTPIVAEGGITNSNGYMLNFDGSIGVRSIQFGDSPGSSGWSASQYINNDGSLAMGGGAFTVDSGGNTFAPSYSGGSSGFPNVATFPNGMDTLGIMAQATPSIETLTGTTYGARLTCIGTDLCVVFYTGAGYVTNKITVSAWP